jgi:hypothetical protein
LAPTPVFVPYTGCRAAGSCPVTQAARAAATAGSPTATPACWRATAASVAQLSDFPSMTTIVLVTATAAFPRHAAAAHRADDFA